MEFLWKNVANKSYLPTYLQLVYYLKKTNNEGAVFEKALKNRIKSVKWYFRLNDFFNVFYGNSKMKNHRKVLV